MDLTKIPQGPSFTPESSEVLNLSLKDVKQQTETKLPPTKLIVNNNNNNNSQIMPYHSPTKSTSPLYYHDCNSNITHVNSPEPNRIYPETPTLGHKIQLSEISSMTPELQRISSDPLTKSKTPRPFKALTKNPLQFVCTPDLLMDSTTDEYIRFRHTMLSTLQNHQSSGTNKNMRRNSLNAQNPHSDDPSYWEKRRKNNEAAKRSRDARRAKEDEIAIRCAFLEQQNLKLKIKIGAMERELQQCHRLHGDRTVWSQY